MQQFALRFAVSAPRKPRKANCEYGQRWRKFIELKTLETARQGIRQLADFEAHA
jgi:hypothetical protein